LPNLRLLDRVHCKCGTLFFSKKVKLIKAITNESSLMITALLAGA